MRGGLSARREWVSSCPARRRGARSRGLDREAWKSKPGATKPKPGTIKSKSGASKSKEKTTKSKSLLLAFQWVSVFGRFLPFASKGPGKISFLIPIEGIHRSEQTVNNERAGLSRN